jgi:hypothetical protein
MMKIFTNFNEFIKTFLNYGFSIKYIFCNKDLFKLTLKMIFFIFFYLIITLFLFYQFSYKIISMYMNLFKFDNKFLQEYKLNFIFNFLNFLFNNTSSLMIR